ncbi:helix-turn-helix domain-containing protein [Ligilactobacillus ruminis]|uniref:DNA-binding helix-turn-helix protein n=1 Tax=Ligilactobacillus ruminis ATCC 25644 TaxID=525362 RepID=E7FPC7_9LACO|nr:helix-turn-helix transcriptional regulator [Ligilactobacillus ruminis]EFZ35169.1 DNA-binding helix-turn-helix protein [Ligilactobacillus ruminis ATCC 25644]EGX97940.1 Cro/CI family phage transcriptional regulator [Ligilactobacillus ruminis ATCC 25644]UWP41060.1 helix-turn-helix domain-containing protein [Ligilactobacillus ruminis]
MIMLDRIQELARKRNKNLKEVSRELGFSENYLYTLKTQAPSSDKLIKLANYFDVSTDYLLGRTDNKNLLDDSKKQKPEIQSLARKMDAFSQSDLEAVEDFLDFIMHKNKNK